MTKQELQKEIAATKKTVHDYIDDVLSGKILACRFVELAVQRHLDDLKNGHERGLIFREEKAYHAVKFFSFLKLWKGKEYKGKEFVLAPHRIFITWVLMGWYRNDGTRRFRKAYDEEARKSAKTTYAGGLGAYFLIADGEEAAEIYCAAVKRDQAKLVWDNIKNLTKHSGFAKNINYLTYSMSIEATNSKCEPLSSDAKSLDGLDTHFASLDELHAHPTREVFDLIDDSVGARQQPLIFVITTAGFNQTGICYEMREYLTQILKGTIQDDSFFGIIFTLDTKKDWPDLKAAKEMEGAEPGSIQEDDWTNEDIWIKAAPALIGTAKSGKKYGIDKNGEVIPGYMTKLTDMRDKCRIAIQMPSAQNNFLTKRLNIWTQQENRWIDLALWDQNNVRPVLEDNLLNKMCVGGIDLSAISDLTIWSMLFPDLNDKDLVDILIRVWCPEARLFDRKNKYRDQYQAWKKQGHLFTTEGDAIDYDFIRAQIVADNDKFNINSISVDRAFQGYEFSQKLDAELGGNEKDSKVIACGMGFLSMAGPCQEFERRLLIKKLNHGGNPILRWMADNVSVKTDPAGNKKPDKATSQGKIDGIIGILLGLDRLLRNPEPVGSVYDGLDKAGMIARMTGR
jgi:phage terminase large subunit-like protein